MNALKECNYNDYACEIAIDADVLESRTIEEQIRLMSEYVPVKVKIRNTNDKKNRS